MLAANRSLIDLIGRLMSDAGERAKFHGDGEGYLRRHGLEDVSGEDIADAMPFVFEELADDAVAARFTAYAGDAGVGDFDLSRSFGQGPPRPPMRLQGESDLESAVRHLNHITTAETTIAPDDAMHVRSEVIDSSFKREILGSRVTRFLDDDGFDEHLDTDIGDDGHLVGVGVGQAGREELFGDDLAIDPAAGEPYGFGGRGDPAAAVDDDGYSVGHVARGDHTTTLDSFDTGGTDPSAPLETVHVGPPDTAADFDAGSMGGGLDGQQAVLHVPREGSEWMDVPAEPPEVPFDHVPPEPEPPMESAPDPEPDPLADPWDSIG